MSRSGQKHRGDGRPITAQDEELWHRATSNLQKLKTKPRVTGKADVSAAPAGPREGQDRRAKPDKQPAARQQVARVPLSTKPGELDRRTVRQIGSGKIEIEARLDLHGHHQAQARMRLRAFLLDAHARELKTVLVITGKGGELQPPDPLAHVMGMPQRGVLRRSVPLWLEEPELRAIVLGYTSAGVQHGGEGALYVRLRKPRDG
jgi:DNA-nicking Smr family endonuclease